MTYAAAQSSPPTGCPFSGVCYTPQGTDYSATMGSVTADGNNHISGFSYDASGNTQNDGTTTYTYDAESQIKSAAGVTYSYDGSGRRVSKSDGKLYWYGSGGEILAETDAAGNTLNEYIFFGGKRIAVISATAGESLPIQNSSFEIADPWTYQACNNTCFWNGGPIPDWTISGGLGGGSFQPGPTYYNLPLPDGNVVAWSNASTISQTLTGIGLLPNTTYTLSVYIGHRSDDLATTYSVSLLAGSTTLNTVSGSNSTIPLGQFAKVTLTYTTGSSVTPGDLSIALGSGGQQIDFDAVSLATSGGIYYYVEDLLGTSRVMTTAAGAVCYDGDFDPYGGEHTYTDTCPQNYKFEGRVAGFVLANPALNKERDTETGNDDFGARYYTSRFGRWLSADWSSVPVPVPYANLTNPQTLNLYAMVADDPESFADLDGHVQNASEGVQNTGRTCASTGQGGAGSAYSGTCGAGQTANQTLNEAQAEASKQNAQTPGCISPSGCTAWAQNPSQDQPQQNQCARFGCGGGTPRNSDFVLPPDPTGLGPEWTKDPRHKNPNGEKWVNPDGDVLEWHRGKPGEPGFQGEDHWHWRPGGKKLDDHRLPGETIKTYGPAIAKVGVVVTAIVIIKYVAEALAVAAAF